MIDNDRIGAVMVVGGGIGGIQASLDLADSGYKVYLVEESPAIGGRMAQLDKTFPTNDCSMCILSPKLVECGRHPNIELLTYSELLDVQGEAGNFEAKVLKRARSVDESLCTGCGICREKCPWRTPSEFDGGLSERKAIYVPYPQAIPNVPVIDRELCVYFQRGRCRACERFCPAGAIDFSQEDQEVKLRVGSVILAPGYEVFDPRLRGEYGYGRHQNVVTSLELERILSASGPYQGEVLRPGDKKHPRRLAWIQCVGSRDPSVGCGYCSSVCCMYAIKEAIIAREHQPDLELAIFYNDVRAFGKGFEAYYENAQRSGIRFVKSIVSGVKELQQSKNLLVSYAAGGGVQEEEFDLVVLSVGLKVPVRLRELAERLGLELDQYGFCQTNESGATQTSRPGVFVCGVFEGPKDIPETVMQASAAAAGSAALLSSIRGTLVKEKEYPSEKDVSEEPPRIGVFVCHCGINIGGVVNVPEVKEYAATLPDVVFADENLYTCSQDAQELIKEKMREHNLNRVVVASCTPRTHEPLFRETVKEAGLNQYLFEMANIRDQCSWVHMQNKEAATEKAKDLVRMAVAKARLLKPLQQYSVQVTPVALVVGGGIAGLTAARNLSEQGFEVHLVEKETELGGMARRVYYSMSGEDVQGRLRELVGKVCEDPRIHLHLGSEIEDVSGSVGNFTTTVVEKEQGGREQIKHGAAVIAIGGRESQPGEYLYGQDPRVLTLLELEQKLARGDEEVSSIKNAVFIQCVGSRNEERPYCSRICCAQAVKCVLKLKELNPDANIYVLYRDMRTYGLNEDRYREAREKGVLFIRYEAEEPPVVERGQDGRLEVTVLEPEIGERVRLEADLLALAAATIPQEGNGTLAQLFKVPLDANGFFLEAHMKLRPVDFATDGVFLCGLAHTPKTMDESIDQALAASSRAARLLSSVTLTSEGTVASIDKDICSGCKQCIRVCPYEAISFIEDEEVAELNEALCKGCGNCAAACPSGACSLRGFEDAQIVAQIEALVGE